MFLRGLQLASMLGELGNVVPLQQFVLQGQHSFLQSSKLQERSKFTD